VTLEPESADDRTYGSRPFDLVCIYRVIPVASVSLLVLVVISVLLGPETKGKRLTADVEVIKVAAQPAT
jgi:hypothetical protein